VGLGIRLRRFILPVVVVALAAASPAAAVEAPPGAAPSPSRLPVFHEAQSNGAIVGHISIPAIGLEETIRSGMSLKVIDQGVAHWVGTASPGRPGNVVLAGHRTTHTAPFRDLDALTRGDLVYLTGGNGFPVMYRVVETFIVAPEDIWITYDVPGASMLTMFACHPKGSARQRIVVTATLVAGGQIA
jgi:sortase A